MLKPMRRVLQHADRRIAGRLDGIAANSAAVADRIHRFWNREARVIHPPVDTNYFCPGVGVEHTLDLPDGFLLGFGRWIGYKNLDLVIKTAEAAGRPAVIAGAGPLAPALRRQAAESRSPVLIVEAPGQGTVLELLRRAAVLVFPTHEDFGLIPVEAQACGTAVVALAAGGALETVIDGRTGALVAELTVHALVEGVERAASTEPEEIRRHALQFSYQVFANRIKEWVTTTCAG
jgi:glycosyltransferase involved in cell wall biosynthesis